MDKLISAAKKGDLNLFKQLEEEMGNIDWDKCHEVAFLEGNFNIVKYCDGKGKYWFNLLPCNLEDINFTLKEWKECMYWAAGVDRINTLMWCELKIAEKYGCIIGLENFRVKRIDGFTCVERDEDNFYEKIISGQDEHLENSLPVVKFSSDCSITMARGNKMDIIAHGKEKKKMIKCLKKSLKKAKRAKNSEIIDYLKDKLYPGH